MNCDQCQDRLGELLDGQLDESAAEMRSHLATCAPCAAEWRAQERVWAILASAPSLESPTGFVARTVRLAVAEDAPRPIGWWIFWPVAQLRLVGVGVAVAALALTGVLWTATRPTPSPAVAEQQEFLQQLPLMANLDLLQDFDVIERLDTLDSKSSPDAP